MSEGRPLNGAWSDLAKPSQWVPLVGFALTILDLVIHFESQQAQDEQSLSDFKAQTEQSETDFKNEIVATIADMKSNQLPRRVQTLEDEFTASQAAQASQFQATQASIAGLQASLQTSTAQQNGAMHDFAVTLGNQSNQIATLIAQFQYWQGQPDGHRR